MSFRSLAFVFGLTLGDYLLWNWSLNTNHDVLALVSGLTLPPLALACLWMLAVSALRLLGSSTRRSGHDSALASSAVDADQTAPAAAGEGRTTGAAGSGREASSVSSGSSPSSSGKLAA